MQYFVLPTKLDSLRNFGGSRLQGSQQLQNRRRRHCCGQAAVLAFAAPAAAAQAPPPSSSSLPPELWQRVYGASASQPLNQAGPSGAPISMPEVQVPSLQLPNVQLPQVQLPKVQLPEVQLPGPLPLQEAAAAVGSSVDLGVSQQQVLEVLGGAAGAVGAAAGAVISPLDVFGSPALDVTFWTAVLAFLGAYVLAPKQ